jgi:hypothetical protein
MPTERIGCPCCYWYLDENGECPCYWEDCPEEPGCLYHKGKRALKRALAREFGRV